MSKQNDRYSENDRRLYNRDYYETHREELNRKRKKRRALKKASVQNASLVLQDMPPEERELLRHTLLHALGIILRNAKPTDVEAQNFPKQSEGA
jgi:hypothetical protein